MANRYSPIWNRLKRDGHVTLAIPIGIQARVIKAVIRTKDEDVLYKLELSESHKWAKLSYKQESARVRFVMRIHDDLKDLALEDF